MRDSGQRKLTYSSQNHCTSSRSVYLSRRLDSHGDKFAVTHHLKEVGVFLTEINIRENSVGRNGLRITTAGTIFVVLRFTYVWKIDIILINEERGYVYIIIS